MPPTFLRPGCVACSAPLGQCLIRNSTRDRDMDASKKQKIEHLDTKTRVAVDAYTKGVNAYLDGLRRGEHEYPPEFLVYRVEPEPWT